LCIQATPNGPAASNRGFGRDEGESDDDEPDGTAETSLLYCELAALAAEKARSAALASRIDRLENRPVGAQAPSHAHQPVKIKRPEGPMGNIQVAMKLAKAKKAGDLATREQRAKESIRAKKQRQKYLHLCPASYS
jgi:hypothetical protein